jgi:tetratricopeptide (TPR) repeat protein
MERAVSAGGDVPENLASVQTLLGGLQFNAGRLTGAERAYRTALVGVPGYVPASAGLAQVEAARGRLEPAIARLRRAVERLPLPQYVVQLGETQLAAGRRAAARRTFGLVGAEERLLQANGVNTDVDLALFEAGHGDAARAVVLARRAWAEAPSVRSADALTWALTRAGRAREALPWARRALRLGTRDPLFLFHAGIAARAAGERGLGRARLSRALAANPRFSPVYAPLAREALR